MRRGIGLAASAVALGILGGAISEAEAGGKLKGSVRVDGSSTVFPITEAVAEEFRSVQPKVRVTVGFSGTGGGFKKFNVGETDINDASRPIKGKESVKAKESGIEVKVAEAQETRCFLQTYRARAQERHGSFPAGLGTGDLPVGCRPGHC